MARFSPVTRERHAAKRWRRPVNFAAAAGSAVVPVVGGELARLAAAMPVAFFEQSGRYQLVAVLSLTPGHNMFVGSDGRWVGGYIPAWCRSYPFHLVQPEGSEDAVLCVDEEGALIAEGESGGEDFFDPEGAVSQALRPIVDLLLESERSRKATEIAVSALAEAGVITPWPITVKTDEGEKPLTGLHRIDEPALNALGDEGFLKLRKASALPVAYAQLLSMGQLSVFADLAKLQVQLARVAAAAAPPPRSLDSLLQMLPDEIVRFE
jgi:hypothetical protein